MKIRPVVKCHGGKWFLNEWILDHFPENYRDYDYVEPYIGGGSVFLNKQPPHTGIEVINDKNWRLMQIFRALRDDSQFFIGKLKKVRYCEKAFEDARTKKDGKDPLPAAIALNEFIVRRMSRGGLCKNFAWSERQRGNKPGDVNAWKTIIKELPAVSERLQGVYILSEKALDVIYAFNAPNVLLYCDPPYLPETRTSTDSYGEYEMTAEEHDTLAQMLLKFRGKVIISGYPSVLYKRLYKDWRCVKKNIANHASQAKVKEDRTEVLWMNY